MPQLHLAFEKNVPVNLIENVLIDFLKNVVQTVPFSVSTMLFFICRINSVFIQEITVFN